MSVFDTVLLVALLTAAIVLDTGGGVLRVAGIRISVQSAWRPFVLAVGLLLLRMWLYRGIGPFGRSWRDLATRVGWIEDFRSAQYAPVPSWRELSVALLGLTAAVVIVFHEQFADFYRVPDLGDPLFSMWRLAWVSHQIVSDPTRLFDANIFYPTRGALTYSDSIILPGLTAAPLLWAGVPLAVVYNVLFQSAFILSGLATYALVRGLGVGRAGAWTAAAMFALHPFRTEHYSHLELQMAQWMPMALLAAHRLLLTTRPRYAACLAAVLGAQWYSSMYFGMFLTAYVAAFVAVLAVVWRRGWRPIAFATGALAMGVVLALPLARAYAQSQPERGTRPIGAVEEYSARLDDYLQPDHRSAMYGTIPFGKRDPERNLFPGVTPIVLAAAGAVPPLSAARLAVLMAGVVAFDGSLGLNGHWYPLAYDLLPPLKSVRVPARFALLVGLTLAVLAGFGVDRLCRRFSSTSARRVAVAVMTAAIFVDLSPDLSLQPVWRHPPPIYGSLESARDVVLFEYPIHPNHDWFAENIPYMYFSTWHWTPMVNGYSGFAPQSYRDLAEETAGFPRGQTVEYLKGIGVTHVGLHCALWDELACSETIKWTALDPRLDLIAQAPWEGASTRLYRLR